MTREDLLSILASVGLPLGELKDAADDALLAGYGLDSLGQLQILLKLEQSSGQTIPDELFDSEHFATLGSLKRLVSMLEKRAQ